MLQSMSSDDCQRVWDALNNHVAADFDAESQVAIPLALLIGTIRLCCVWQYRAPRFTLPPLYTKTCTARFRTTYDSDFPAAR